MKFENTENENTEKVASFQFVTNNHDLPSTSPELDDDCVDIMSVNGASQNYENTVDQNVDAESILKNSNANINPNVDKEEVSPSAEVYNNLTARKISNDRPDNNLPIIFNYLYIYSFSLLFS